MRSWDSEDHNQNQKWTNHQLLDWDPRWKCFDIVTFQYPKQQSMSQNKEETTWF